MMKNILRIGLVIISVLIIGGGFIFFKPEPKTISDLMESYVDPGIKINIRSPFSGSVLVAKKGKIIFEKAIIGISRMFEIKPSVIFIDPPYNKEDINLILLTILKKNIKSKDTVLIIEIERKDQIVIPGDFNVFKEKIYGKTKLLFLN